MFSPLDPELPTASVSITGGFVLTAQRLPMFG
jgi:hypothetical protein